MVDVALAFLAWVALLAVVAGFAFAVYAVFALPAEGMVNTLAAVNGLVIGGAVAVVAMALRGVLAFWS